MTIQPHSWQTNILLEGFSPEELAKMESHARERPLQPGELLVQEGEQGEAFFFVVSGSLEVIKEGSQIQILGPGDVVGELAILGGKPRMATVRALELTVIQEISVKDLSSEILEKLAKNLSHLFSTRLSTTNQATAQALRRELHQARRRVGISSIAAPSVIGIALYEILGRQVLQYLPLPYFPIFSAFYLIGIAWYLCRDVQRQGYPLSMFGVTLRNWKRSLQETLLFMIPLFLAVVVIKKVLILTDDAYAGQPLFRLGLEAVPETFAERFVLISVVILYTLFAPVQELIFRGITQTSWQRFGTGRHRTVLAILTSSFLYLDTHFYWSLSFIVLIPSFLWGWLFARHRTLVGISVGHMLIGIWTFWVVGLSF